LRKDLEKRISENDNLKDGLDKALRKLAFKNEELEKELKEHERTTE
jgi:mRNA-degrading endonuclease YafQ of YafQ-DinJ toxin-antitoxin module